MSKTMLQSAIYSDLHALDLGSASMRATLSSQRVGQKGSFARIAAWSRSLILRDQSLGLSGHLLRDIGAFEPAAS